MLWQWNIGLWTILAYFRFLNKKKRRCMRSQCYIVSFLTLDFNEIWYERYDIGGHPNTKTFKFL
jgi:lambda repressor-like predicted transcriptional regulator